MSTENTNSASVGSPRPSSSVTRRVTCWILFLFAWGLSNVAVIAGNRFYESRMLEAQYDVPAYVVRSFEERSVRVILAATNNQPFPLSYRYRPPPMFSKQHSVPLLVFLHGSGDRGSDNIQQLRSAPAVLCRPEIQEDFSCAVLAPQCPENHLWGRDDRYGADVLDAVLVMLDDILKDSRLDPDRVYLTGYSMGSFGCWRLAARVPERFAAVLPIAGGGNPDWGPKLLEIPLWAVHGKDDEVVSEEASREMIDAIRDAGGSPNYSAIAGLGHGAWDEVFRADSPYLAWLFQQRLSQRSRE